MKRMQDSVQITGDNTNVYNGRIGEKPPSWARKGRLAFTFSDQDALWSAKIGDDELARDSAPSACEADNLNVYDWTKPHIEFDIPTGRSRPANFEVLVAVNVVTGGTGMMHLEYMGG